MQRRTFLKFVGLAITIPSIPLRKVYAKATGRPYEGPDFDVIRAFRNVWTYTATDEVGPVWLKIPRHATMFDMKMSGVPSHAYDASVIKTRVLNGRGETVLQADLHPMATYRWDAALGQDIRGPLVLEYNGPGQIVATCRHYEQEA